mmetsp:Transcript_16477/g.25428  ORF Transcript_16477/g.25428 Transcript_16477/m.25428 type:complete len:109 (-) Transcript_16477:2004-2330(-)
MDMASCFIFVPQSLSKRGGNRQAPPSSRFIDIDKVQAAVLEFEFTSTERDTAKRQQRTRKQALEILDQIKDSINDFIINSGGSAFKVFKALDTDGSNYLSPEELYKGL